MTSKQTPAAEMAAAAMSAMVRELYVPRRRLFGDRRWTGCRHWETLWPFADAWSAVSILQSIDGDKVELLTTGSFLEGLDAYRRATDPPDGDAPIGYGVSVRSLYRRKATRFYDDNSWLVLAIVRAHQLRRDPELLSLATRVMEFVLSGWSDDPDATHPGGIRWNDGPNGTTRNTCTNGPAAEAALRLHALTGEQGWLDWAVRIYGWTRAALLRADNLYLDHIRPDGTTVSTIWSYNQGTMIGAGVLLSEATGDRGSLEEAVATADAAIRHFTPDILLKQPSPFNAVYFSNLRLLSGVRADVRIELMLAAYAEQLWRTRVDQTGLPVDPSVSPLNAAAAAITIDALVGGASTFL
jgi:hypothetical protein